MMNVKFVRVKVTKSEIFLFFFLFSKILTSCQKKRRDWIKTTNVQKRKEKGKKKKTQRREERSCAKKKVNF